MNNPTKKQTQLLEFITEFTTKHGFSPSYREIMHAMNLRSVSAVAEHVDNCVAAGYLQKIPKSARSLLVIVPKMYNETVDLFHEKLDQLRSADAKNPQIAKLIEAAQILEIEI